ncbi:MAG: 2Fe-2S iron-sulfur cluster-binding protein [Phycisphaerales bacterium]
MPSITINGTRCEFTPGQTILQVANAGRIDIPQYCYHDGLSIVASCRICLVEVHAPNPKSGKLEPFMGGKLVPSCQQTASDGMVVYSNSPKAVANQKSVMEYLLINHPLDCPVCDQAGECFLQDYSYQYGRGVSRFEESKVKQPKKDLGPHVYLYADRCIMCTRCVRFTREVAGTGELLVAGRGNKEEIDVFPGVPIDNPLSGNVIDLCPVGALLDKDFLFAQRVWFLKSTPSIDGITASGDNILFEHNEGKVYRIKPRENGAINRWWITDEVRYGWKHIHSSRRLATPMRRQYGALVESDLARAHDAAIDGVRDFMALGRLAKPDETRPILQKGQTRPKRLAVLVSPMLSCEDAFLLAELARFLDPKAILGVGPVPTSGQDQVLPAGAKEGDKNAFVVSAEKAPNARGVRRVLEGFGGSKPLEFDAFVKALKSGKGEGEIAAVVLTGNYPAADGRGWASGELIEALAGRFTVLLDTLESPLVDDADVVLPSCTWAEKAGTFENRTGVLQAFEQAIPALEGSRAEAQIALDLLAHATGQDRYASADGTPVRARDIYGAVVEVIDEGPGQVPAAFTVAVPKAPRYNAAAVRERMAREFKGLGAFGTEVRMPAMAAAHTAAVEMVEL